MTAQAMNLGRDDLRLRDATNDDEATLRALYASSRERELAVTDWSDEQKAAFCDMQFKAQHSHYKIYYPTANYWLIERVRDVEGMPCEAIVIGRLYWARLQSECEDVLMEMTLWPSERGGGLGTDIVKRVLAWAQAEQRIVSMHVEHENPSIHLSERVGFVRVGDAVPVQKLLWYPSPISSDATMPMS
jgi:RimJ/RimL family protein N-acetyltransferase